MERVLRLYGIGRLSKESGKVSMKKRLVFILSLILMITFASNTFASSTKRLAGQTRYDTSAAIALDGWTQSDYALLAYGENYPDALSAAPLAKKHDAPILLTSGNNLPTITKETLINLQVKNVFIIGGTGVIPSSIDSELQSMRITVTRIAGQDRYETATKVAQQLSSPTEIFVVTGEDSADALSVAPIAALKQVPIILMPQEYMPDSVRAYLASNNIDKTYVMGDSGIIGDNVTNQFPGTERIIGVNKYERNIKVNETFDSIFSSQDICTATGEGFADALTGTAYAAKKGMPVVLVNSYMPMSTREFTVDKLNRADSCAYVLGGTSVVPDAVIARLYTLPDSNETAMLTPEVISRLRSYPYFQKKPMYGFEEFAKKYTDGGQWAVDNLFSNVWRFADNEKFYTNKYLVYMTWNGQYVVRGVLHVTDPNGDIREQDLELEFLYGKNNGSSLSEFFYKGQRDLSEFKVVN